MPVPQVPEALSRGVIDGAVIPWEISLPLKVHELTSYHSEIKGKRGLYSAVFLLAMHKPTYEKLPKELKEIIDKNSGMELAKKAGILWDNAEKGGRDAAKSSKNKIIFFDRETTNEIERITHLVSRNWITDMRNKKFKGQDIYDEAVRLIKKHSDND